MVKFDFIYVKEKMLKSIYNTLGSYGKTLWFIASKDLWKKTDIALSAFTSLIVVLIVVYSYINFDRFIFQFLEYELGVLRSYLVIFGLLIYKFLIMVFLAPFICSIVKKVVRNHNENICQENIQNETYGILMRIIFKRASKILLKEILYLIPLWSLSLVIGNEIVFLLPAFILMAYHTGILYQLYFEFTVKEN